jgi:hypothetical protein
MDAKGKESCLPPPRPSAGIRFNEGFLRIPPFVVSLPALILLLIADGAISVLSTFADGAISVLSTSSLRARGSSLNERTV